MEKILENIRNADRGSELLAYLARHMQGINQVREAQIVAVKHAIRHFDGDAESMVADYRHNGLFHEIVTEYGRNQLGL